MASSKDIQHSSRPLSQHRPTMSSPGSSLPVRAHSRAHSHSVSTGSLNASHRVSRRKSVSSNAANVAAVAIAVREAGEGSFAMSMPSSTRRNTGSRVSHKSIGQPTPPSSLPSHRASMIAGRKLDRGDSAIDDEMDDLEDDETAFEKVGMRRASESATFGKGDGKKGHPNDLKCDKCGKGYKHSSCLTKHLWEHTPEWSLTSKLLISKHQQVQLLEAASVLVAMNNDGTTPPHSAKDFQSDQGSASPEASGSSDHRSGLSSADTTPPPQDINYSYAVSYSNRPKRYSSGNNFSRSYQSATSYSGSVPNGSDFGGMPRSGSRPLSSGFTSGGQEDEAGLAAAVGLLSCSFGTPRSGPVHLPPDVPPVPPLPAQYLGHSAFSGSTLTGLESSAPRASTSYVRGRGDEGRERRQEDVKMEESEGSMGDDDDDFDARSRTRSDEDDEGVFGRMEE